jgi:thiamine-monophosphate kinase
VDEFALIRQIIDGLGSVTSRSNVIVGPGDDAAVLRPRQDWDSVASIDTQIVDRHFPRQAPADLIGYRAMMAAISDLAAMAADPNYVLIALALPDSKLCNSEWVGRLVKGIKEAAETSGVVVAGGNLGRGELALTISVHGEVPANAAILRSGAKPGDILQVSGALGGAAACVRLDQLTVHETLSELQQCYFRPRARLDLVEVVRNGANAAIDVSDGLLQDLGHMLSASNCGAELVADSIPVALGASRQDALTGGDDYQLLVSATELLEGFKQIGKAVSDAGLWLDGKPVQAQGFDHFREQ